MASSVRREFESRVSRLAARLSASSSRMPLLHATGHLTQGAPWYLRRSCAVFRFAHTGPNPEPVPITLTITHGVCVMCEGVPRGHSHSQRK